MPAPFRLLCEIDTEMRLGDLDGDGQLEELRIAGIDLVVLDAATGEDRWVLPGTHIQTAAVGKFYPDMEGLQILAAERRWASPRARWAPS